MKRMKYYLFWAGGQFEIAHGFTEKEAIESSQFKGIENLVLCINFEEWGYWDVTKNPIIYAHIASEKI